MEEESSSILPPFSLVNSPIFYKTLRWKLELKATTFHGKLYNDKAESLY